MNIFEQATRVKLRFNMRGVIGVEELWDLSLKDLNTLYGTLMTIQRTSNTDSLISVVNKEDAELQLRIDVVKHIFNAKNDEKIAREKSSLKKAERARLMEALERKQSQELENLSPDEIKKMIASCDDTIKDE